jgi:hypothetical protein
VTSIYAFLFGKQNLLISLDATSQAFFAMVMEKVICFSRWICNHLVMLWMAANSLSETADHLSSLSKKLTNVRPSSSLKGVSQSGGSCRA